MRIYGNSILIVLIFLQSREQSHQLREKIRETVLVVWGERRSCEIITWVDGSWMDLKQIIWYLAALKMYFKYVVTNLLLSIIFSSHGQLLRCRHEIKSDLIKVGSFLSKCAKIKGGKRFKGICKKMIIIINHGIWAA